MPFPILVSRPISPPLMNQGVKTRLIPFIFPSIKWKGKGIWYEGFFGVGAVLFNAIYHGRIKNAVVTDINPYIIDFYKNIQAEKLILSELKKFMIKHALKMKRLGKPYYYEFRDKFNSSPSSKLLLFLNLSCFRHSLRFNSEGKLTSAFGNRGLYDMKGVRLRLINTYLRRIKLISRLFKVCKVELLNEDFRELFDLIKEPDFVYFDPPYLNKRLDYYGKEFTVKDWMELVYFSQKATCHLCLSNWYSDFQGYNKHLQEIEHYGNFNIRKTKYRYNLSIDSKKSNVIECIITNKRTTATISDLPNLMSYFKKKTMKV